MPTCSLKVAALITLKTNWANLGVTTFGFYLNTLEGIWLSLATQLFIQGRERETVRVKDLVLKHLGYNDPCQGLNLELFCRRV